jgi:hypothetical protein
MPDIPRGLGDGSYDIKGRYLARVMTLTGSFLTPSPSLVEAARDRLISATNLVYKGAWLKTGLSSDNKRSSFVRLSGAPQIQTVTARGRTEFSIGLKAADPIKYAWNDSDPDGYERIEIPGANRVTAATGIEIVNNIGNAPVPVNLEISGPVTGPARVHNKTTDEILFIVSSLRGRLTSSIVNKQMDFNETTLEDVVTLTTRTAHEFLVGDTVEISGLSEEDLNGDFLIIEVPTSTTFKYSIAPFNRSLTRDVVAKKLVSNVATIVTQENHGFSVGNSIFIKDVDSVFNGTYTITGTPTVTSFTFSKNRNSARTVIGAVLISNIATITTSESHGFVEGEQVTIAGLDVNYNGVYTISSVPSATTFNYSVTRTNAKALSSRSMTNDVATVTASATHGLVVGETIQISGMDVTANQSAIGADNPFNGIFSVKTIPTPTTFTYDVPRLYSSNITTTARASGVGSITVSDSIQASVGDEIVIENLANTSYNGTRIVTAVLSSTTYVFSSAGADEAPISVTAGKVSLLSIRPLSAVVAGGNFDVIFSGTHNFIVGEQVNITGLGSNYNGTYTVLDIPQFNVIRLNGVGKPAIDSNIVAPPISLRARTGSTVTITTSVAHNLVNGQYARVVGLEAALNGTWVVTVTGANTFTYTTPSSGNISSSAPSGSGTAYILGANVVRSRSVASTNDSAELRVNGSLPFSAYASGTATIQGDIVNSDGSEFDASGFAVKKANIPFTPGITGAIADFGPDILEVNTQTRDVALNGSYDGARAKLDVLTDFFFLEPGNNEIEFKDDGNSTSTALLKVFYRSGWLG